ncbi:MAG: NosD domain-containing protein [Salinigranum sp.]
MAETIDSLTRITEPGTYRLDGDLGGDGVASLSEAAIRIEADDVVLDGGGHALAGNGVSDSTAVAVAASRPLTGVTVRDLRVVDWEIGLYVRGVTDVTVRGVEATDNGYGMLVENSRRCRLRGSTVRGNLIGVCLAPPGGGFSVGDSSIERNRLRDLDRRADCLSPSSPDARASERSNPDRG